MEIQKGIIPMSFSMQDIVDKAQGKYKELPHYTKNFKSTKLYPYKGLKLCNVDLAEIAGISKNTMLKRLKKMTAEEAVHYRKPIRSIDPVIL